MKPRPGKIVNGGESLRCPFWLPEHCTILKAKLIAIFFSVYSHLIRLQKLNFYSLNRSSCYSLIQHFSVRLNREYLLNLNPAKKRWLVLLCFFFVSAVHIPTQNLLLSDLI